MTGANSSSRGGYVLLHRSQLNAPYLKRERYTEVQVVIWALSEAAYADHNDLFNGRLVPLKRGQFVTSIRAMAAEFRWTPKQVRCFMKRMAQAGVWNVGKAGKGPTAPTLIGLPDYDQSQAWDSKGTARFHKGHSKGAVSYKESKAKKLTRSGGSTFPPSPCRIAAVPPSAMAGAFRLDEPVAVAGYVTPEEASAILAEVGFKSLSKRDLP